MSFILFLNFKVIMYVLHLKLSKSDEWRNKLGVVDKRDQPERIKFKFIKMKMVRSSS